MASPHDPSEPDAGPSALDPLPVVPASGRATLARSGRVVACDPAWEAITGVEAGGDLIERVQDADAAWLARLLRHGHRRLAVAVRSGRSDAIVRSLLHLEGEERGDRWEVVARRSLQPRPTGDDVEASVGALRVTEDLHDAVWVASIGDGRVVYANGAWRELAERDADDADRDWLGWILPDDRDRVRAEAATWLAEGAMGQLRQAFRARRRDGAVRRLVGVASAVHGDDGAPAFACCVAMDLTDLEGLDAGNGGDARADPITGLLDRRGFDDVLANTLRRCARGDAAALLLLDLDGFKALNDTRGHIAGDALLEQVGTRIREALREGDRAARIGGDEFAVVLRHADGPEARAAAERLLSAVQLARAETLDPLASTQASGGLALLPPGTPLAAEEAVLRADLALQEAKAANPGGLVEYPHDDDEDAARLRSRASWSHRLLRALEGDRLALLCRPIADVRSREVLGMVVDLLLDDGEVAATTEELRLHARRSGLQDLLDQWTLRRAIELAGTDELPAGIPLAVPVAATVLDDRSLLPRLHNDVLQAGIAADRITLAVRGEAPLASPEVARASARGLRRLGVGVLLDGFGSTTAPLELLRAVPFSGVRIAPVFARAREANAIDDAIVRWAVDLGGAFELLVAADGVATRGDLERLRELGVAAASGPLFGEPVRVGDQPPAV